jgi:hypothetical protein
VTTEEVKIYNLTSREVHMMGEYVGVVWHIKSHKEVSQDFLTGTKTTTEKFYKSGKPYIDFLWIRHDDLNDEWYEDEDSPVDGGLSTQQAETIAQELLRAVEYIKRLDSKSAT